MKVTTLRTAAGTCPDGHTCPSIHVVDEHPDRRYVVSTVVTDPSTVAAFAHLVGPGEQLGWMPAALLPEVGP